MSPTYNINITESAMAQISLISKNDYTIEDSFFRISIDGKGCKGFTYALGFSKDQKDDIKLGLRLGNLELIVLLDPFAAFYCKEGIIDYQRSTETGEEGFIFINYNEKTHQGKFFKDETKTPGVL